MLRNKNPMVKRKKAGCSSDENISERTIVDNGSDVLAASLKSTDGPIISDNQQSTQAHTTSPVVANDPSLNDLTQPVVCTNTLQTSLKALPSHRILARTAKLSIKESISDGKIQKPSVILKQSVVPLGLKARRPWEVWSIDDKNSFFDALCEYGKDFESIQSYIAQRSKKKGTLANMIKNKDQVRHFYYRTWHKISKYLDIPEDIRKHTQEIYGLINYAELRKKIGGGLNEKNQQKLNDLVFKGVTTVKYKGKKIRIKTPVCRALKKMNNVSEGSEAVIEKLPKDIVLELWPHTNQAWLHVQNLAQNPRLRTKVSLQRRLKSVIDYLQNKWKPFRWKKKEEILSHNSQFDSSSTWTDNPPLLRLIPQHHSTMSPFCISVTDSASSTDVCLEKYLKSSSEINFSNELLKRRNHRIKLKPRICGKVTTGTEQTDNIVSQEDKTPDTSTVENEPNPEENFYIDLLTPPKSVEEVDCSKQLIEEAQKSLSFLNSTSSSFNQDRCIAESTTKTNVTESSEMVACNNDDGRKTVPGQDNVQDVIQMTSELNIRKSTDSECVVTEASEFLSHTVLLDSDSPLSTNLECGWTSQTAGLLTVGELYLMLKQPAKLVLEYEFENSLENNGSENNGKEQYKESGICELADIMRKLIDVASTTFAEFRNKQVSVSPTNHSLTHAHDAASPLSNKVPVRCNNKNSNIKLVRDNKNTSVCIQDVDECAVSGNLTNSLELESQSEVLCSTATTLSFSSTTIVSEGTTLDNHVFIAPVGTAPKVIKKPNQESLREEIDKLLPSTRRGCRVRRKPLVVQRPLLPRDSIGTMPRQRPMAVVHLVPSGSPLTAVIPQSCTNVEQKINHPQASTKVVKILPAGIPIETCSVSLIKDANTDLALHHEPIVELNATTTLTCTEMKICTEQKETSIEFLHTPENSCIISSDAMEGVVFSSVQSDCSRTKVTSITSPPQISIPENSCLSSDAETPSFMKISLTAAFRASSDCENLSSESGHISNSLSDSTPPHSPINRPLKVNSPGPDAQWLNGESVEYSLNTLLNTLESPTKGLPLISSNSLINETITRRLDDRLAPVVDSQVRCLLEECSVDFITKFEDLADVINSSNNDSKPA